MPQIASLSIDLIARTASFSDSMKRAQATVESFRKRTEGVTKALDQVAKLGQRAGLALTAMGGSLALLTRQATQYASQMQTIADQTGLAVRQVQELAYAASQSNTDLQALKSGLRAFVRRAAEAAQGNRSFLAGFQRLGLSQRDVQAGLDDIGGLLLEVADRVSRLGTTAEQSAVLMTLMGDAGRQLVPLMARGRDGLQELADEAHRLGLVMGDEQLQRLAALNDRLDALRQRVAAAGREIAAAFLPPIERAIRFVERGLDAFNRLDPALRDQAARWTAMGAAVLAGVAALGMLAKVAPIALQGIGLLAGAGALLLSPFVLQLGIAIAAIGLMARAWESNWLGIRDAVLAAWERIQPVIEAVARWAGQTGQTVWRWVIEAAGDAWEWLRDVGGPWIGRTARTVWQWLVERAGQFWDWFVDVAAPWLGRTATTVWQWLIEAAGTAWTWLRELAWPWLGATASTIWRWTLDWTGAAWEWLRDVAFAWLGRTASTVWWWTVGAVGRLADWLIDVAWPWVNNAVTTVWSWVIDIPDWARRLLEWLREAPRDLIERIFGSPGELPGTFRPLLAPEYQAPGFQRGAILPGSGGPDRYPALLAPGEAVVPARVVRGGWLAVIEWFRRMGVPGFQFGGGFGLPRGAASLTIGGVRLGDFQAWIDSISDAIREVGQTLLRGVQIIIDFVARIVDTIGEALLGERWTQFRDAIADARDRLREFVDSLFAAEETTQQVSRAQEEAAAQTSRMAALWTNIRDLAERAGGSLGERALQAAPLLSSMIQGAHDMGGGGPAASAVGAIVALVSESSMFSGIMQRVNGVLQQLADIAGRLLGAFAPLVDSALKLAQTLLGALEPVITAIANAVGALFVALAPVIQVIGSALAPVLTVLGAIIQALIVPAMQALFPVLKVLGLILGSVAYVIGQVWNGLISTLQSVFRALASINIFGWRPLGFLNDWAASLERAKMDTDAIAKSLQELAGLTWEQAQATAQQIAASYELREAAQEASESLRNVPSGFKYILTRFAVAQAIPMQHGGIVTRPTLALIGERGPEAVLPLGGDGATLGTTIVVEIKGPVYGMDDFDRRVQEAVTKAARRAGMAAYGLARG